MSRAPLRVTTPAALISARSSSGAHSQIVRGPLTPRLGAARRRRDRAGRRPPDTTGPRAGSDGGGAESGRWSGSRHSERRARLRPARAARSALARSGASPHPGRPRSAPPIPPEAQQMPARTPPGDGAGCPQKLMPPGPVPSPRQSGRPTGEERPTVAPQVISDRDHVPPLDLSLDRPNGRGGHDRCQVGCELHRVASSHT